MKKNQALIDELNKELEAELKKEPAQIDTEKIREINKIIARLEGQTKLPESLEKSKFFKEFDRKSLLDENILRHLIIKLDEE